MKPMARLIFPGLFAFSCAALFSPVAAGPQSSPSGPYLGQKLPGTAPEIFAPGTVSRGEHEHRLAVSPDGKEIYYTGTSAPDGKMQILYACLKNGAWTSPAIASFSDKGLNLHPAFAPDGKRLFFVSTRPLADQNGPRRGADIWYVERQGEAWSVPANIGEAVNTENNESSPSVAADGTLFFDRIVKSNNGETGIYLSRLENGVYQKAERLPSPINSDHENLGPFIAPSGRCLLFNSDRPGTLGEADIYIAFKNKDGAWQNPINVGELINSKRYDWAPMVTPDEKYLVFSSYRSSEPVVPDKGKGTFYWVEVNALLR